MPLVGTICCQTGQPSDFEHCLRCARGEGPANCVHPLPLIKFMANKDASRKGVGLSATGIISCPRQNVLLGDHDYYEHPDSFMAAFRGEIWHDGFDKWLADEESVTSEVRLAKVVTVEVPIDDDKWEAVPLTLSGRPDQVFRDRGLIIDTKTVSRPVVCNQEKMTESQYTWCERMRIKEAREKDEQQINVYAWLHRGGYEVESGQEVNVDIRSGGVIYVGEGGKNARKLPVRIWSEREQDDFVHRRLLPRGVYESTGKLPAVLPIERLIRARNTGRLYVKRAWECGYCPVRGVCDSLAERERGISPNEPEYWMDQPGAGDEVGDSPVTGADGSGH